MIAANDPLARLEALLAAATRGPWAVVGDREDRIEDQANGFDVGDCLYSRDAALIVALVNAAEAMIAEIRAGRAIVALIEDGTLVRDTRRDHEPDWARRQIPLVRTLASASAARAATDAALGRTNLR